VNFTEFYRNESCGKCIPCRLGSQKLVQIGRDLLDRRDAGAPLTGPARGRTREGREEITRALQLTSICGWATSPRSRSRPALAYFADQLKKKPGT